MSSPTRHQALLRVREILAEVFERPPGEVEGRDAEPVIGVGGFSFLVGWKGSGSTAAVRAAIDELRRGTSPAVEAWIPLVAVPYMGDVGRRLCQEAGVAWVDLSGNAEISVPGLRVHVQGRPNRFKRRGRPANLFAPKSSRITRWLLIHAGEAVTQRQLARATGMDEGFTSRLVTGLEGEGLVVRGSDGRIVARDPGLLLDAWRETYSFGKHFILRGHIATRSGEMLQLSLSGDLTRLGIEHAATGLGAAWLLSPFAAFRTVTFYLSEAPGAELLRELTFREEARGANVWLVVPNDEGVFDGTEVSDTVCCVHPVQVYLDLAEHPERAVEAAEHLRSLLLRWRHDG